MRILHVTHQYRPAIGGAEQHIAVLSEELARRGHQVTVFTSRSQDYHAWRNELPRTVHLGGVSVRRFRSAVRGRRTWQALEYGYRHYFRTRARRYEPFIFLGNGPLCPGLFLAVLREAPRYDLLHINHLHYSHATTAYVAAKQRGLPTVLTPHIHLEQPVTYDVGYLQAILRGVDHIIADTRAERGFLLEAGFDRGRVTTAGVGIDLQAFTDSCRQVSRRELGLPPDAFVLLFLGRKTEYKGLETTLQAFAILHGQFPHLYLLTVGPETGHSRALWARYGGLPRLINHGSVSDETRVAALAACDCLVLPSSGEAFGIVYLEAWAASKPVIGARSGAVSDLISDGQDGYLVQAGNARQIAARVAHWIQRPEMALEMGQRGREKVKIRFSVTHITDIVEGVYARILRQRHARPAPYQERLHEG
jgi:glycosyltransferase involved in cell wall biosynthesis